MPLRYAVLCLAGQHQLLNGLLSFMPDYLLTRMAKDEPGCIQRIAVKERKPCLDGTFQAGIL